MSFTLQLKAQAPDFNLIGTDQRFYNLDSFKDFPCLVIFFTCNHCPYVKNSDPITQDTCLKFQKLGAKFVAINANSEESYPEDSFAMMIKRMEEEQFPWVYLHDKTQEIALKYGALRTPHFFVFNEQRELIYTGRGIDCPKDPSKMRINNLEQTLEEFFHHQPISTPLTNPIGCNVKWKGKDKHWIPEDACDLVPNES